MPLMLFITPLFARHSFDAAAAYVAIIIYCRLHCHMPILSLLITPLRSISITYHRCRYFLILMLTYRYAHACDYHAILFFERSLR